MDILAFSAISDYIKREIFNKDKLNISQTRILLYFYQTKNKPLTMGTLAKNLRISLSTLSRQLQQKSTKNYIDVIRSENSSSKTVHLNEHGIKKAEELIQTLNELENRMFNIINDKEKDSFIHSLEEISHRYIQHQ